ncbi:hypothetical protein PIROE2DRAFT_21589 [Piromyces sp. E2]|nr:hypothetical protein PIROE2DRAFT_21589 [Piromyces sp. E2]|eukprot:OUM56714.1 hypothetical protein PIROE2DRAFT_21589 [Piromyces sp. E2]
MTLSFNIFNKIITLLFLLITVLEVFGYDTSFFGVVPTNYTIKDIENIKPENSYPCPKESSYDVSLEITTKKGEKFLTCDYQYLCSKENEKCILFNAPMGLDEYYSPGYDNNVYGKAYEIYKSYEHLILVGCSKERYKQKKCNTDTCNSDKDCFSNSCVNGVCMANKNNPIYLCRPVKENSEVKVKCLSSFEENCKNDSDCTSNASCTKDNVCVIERIEENNSQNYTTIIIIGIIAAIVVILILIFILYKKGKIGCKM